MNPLFSSIRTLIDLLQWRASHTPDKIAFITEGKSHSYEWLWRSCQSYAAELRAAGVGDEDRVLVLVPNTASFFVAYYGCILSGGIVVPVFPNAGAERCKQIMQLCGARHLILPANTQEQRRQKFTAWVKENAYQIHWVSENPEHMGRTDFPQIIAEDVAFIQYTSGSTDFPKGVPLTHDNLLSNMKQMVQAMDITSRDVFVSWLPVYHDMGLILNTMVPFYTGAVLVLLEVGLHKVHSWLKAIEHHKGTFIAAPDIAYRLCVKSIRHPEDYDLSSLRVALNASERIRLETYQMFEDTFGLRNVMASGYGLAEATVAVSMQPPGQPPVVDSEGYVASGKALSEIDIRIDPAVAGINQAGVGEILVQSKSLMKGYFNPKNSPPPFDSRGYLRTGDIGYLDQEGNLFVLARKKNCIKHAGHTLYPDDVEQVVQTVTGVRQALAVGIESSSGNGESLHVFAETSSSRSQDTDAYHALAVEIVQKVSAHFGLRPGRVFLLKLKTLPRTPNGKMQHATLKQMYLNNSLQKNGHILYPSRRASPESDILA